MSETNADRGKKSAHHPKMSPPLRRALAAASRRSAARAGTMSILVIIEFDCKPTPRLIGSMRRSIASHTHHFSVKRRLPLLKVVAARVSMPCLHKLCRHRNVVRVHLDRKVRVSLHIATPAIGSARLQRQGVTGNGVTIAVIDTGLFPHPDVTKPANRIAAFKDFVNRRTKPYDDNGHGTHVAGDAAGNGRSSRGKFRGPAPEAKLVIAKAFNQDGEANSSDVMAAVEWVIRHRRRYGTRIVNMSFGTPGVRRCADDPVCRAAERAWRAGLVVVAAAGNGGPGAGTIDSPGISPLVITAGAVNDRRTPRQSDDRIAPFSSRGPVFGGRVKPDLVAPGVGIVSLRAPGSKFDRSNPERRVGRSYFKLSGTSMSTAIVAGAAAQLLQRRPSLSPNRVKALLKRNAVRLRFGRNSQGSGEVDVRFIGEESKK